VNSVYATGFGDAGNGGGGGGAGGGGGGGGGGGCDVVASLVKTFSYDDNGNLTQTAIDPGPAPHLNQISSATYSPTGKVLTATDPSDHTTVYTYDDLDRLATQTNGEGWVIAYGYDLVGHLVTVSNLAIQLPPLEQFAYTPNGMALTLTDANGNQTRYIYDGFDRLIRTIYADQSFELFGYDANDNLLAKQTRSGKTIGYTFDTLNRLATKAPEGELTIAYAYDLAGRPTTVSDSSGNFTYGYDSAGRLISATRPDAKQVSYQYDNASNRTRLTWPDGYYVTYSYDALNRLTAVLENGANSLVQYGYDAASRRTSTSHGNGTSAVYSYAPNSDLTELTHNFTGSSVSFNYGYNTVHGRTSVGVSDEAFLYRPTATSNTSYAPNSMNQYSAVGEVTLSYDGNGNLIGDGTFAYGYDPENRLLTATGPTHSSSYAYDPLGRRSQKIVDGVSTTFLSDGIHEIAEYDGDGNLLRRYVYGAGIDQLIATIDGSGNKSFNHHDGIGSVIALTDSSGAVTDTYKYDVFGNGPLTPRPR
jgi:YD repeat-containing protein